MLGALCFQLACRLCGRLPQLRELRVGLLTRGLCISQLLQSVMREVRQIGADSQQNGS